VVAWVIFEDSVERVFSKEAGELSWPYGTVSRRHERGDKRANTFQGQKDTMTANG
jgi:hypothetical protein